MLPASAIISTKKRTDKSGVSPSSLGNSPVQYNEDGSVVKVKKRLARKAELARASRRRRKAYVQSLEEKVARLSARIIELQKANAANAVMTNQSHSSLGHQVPDSTTFYGPPSYLGGPLSQNGAMEATSDMSSSTPNSASSYLFALTASSNNSTSALTTHTHTFLTDTDNHLDGSSGGDNPLLNANSAAGGLLTQNMLQQSSSAPNKAPLPWWLQGVAVYAVKALFRGDRRRFTVQTSNTSFAELVKSLREIYGLGGPITVSYPDDEGDTIQMTSDAELFEALRIAAAQCKPSQSPQSKSGPTDMHTDDAPAAAAPSSASTSFDAPMSDSAAASTAISTSGTTGSAASTSAQSVQSQSQPTIVLKVFVEANELSVGNSGIHFSQNHGSVSPVTAGVAQLQTSGPSAFAPRPQPPPHTFSNLPFSAVARLPPPSVPGFLPSPPPHLASLAATGPDQNTPLSTTSSDVSSFGPSAPNSSTSAQSSYYSQDESVGIATLSSLASGNDFWGAVPKSNSLGMRRVSSAPAMNHLLRLPAYPVPAIIPTTMPTQDPPTVLFTHGMHSTLPPIPTPPPRRDRQWLSVETPSATNSDMAVGTTTASSNSNAGTGSSFLIDTASLSPKRSSSPRSLSPSSLRSSIQHGGGVHDLMAIASAQVNSKNHTDGSPSKSAASKRKGVIGKE